MTGGPGYRSALARIHHEAFGGHADACAPGILARLAPIRERGGAVLELGCGSGALTRHLVAAGHRVLATDASPAMVALAREAVPGAEEVRRLTLPHDPLPEADAVVAVGHVLSYLPDAPSVERALRAIARVLRPGGVLAVDLLDRGYRSARARRAPAATVTSEWAVFAGVAFPDPGTCIRDITTFVRAADGTWQRDDERHANVLVDAAEMARRLAAEGLEEVEVARGFDAGQRLEDGLVAITGVGGGACRRRPPDSAPQR